MKRVLLILAAGLALAACKTDGVPAINAETEKACKFLGRPRPFPRPAPTIKSIDAYKAQIEECDLALSMDRLANPRAAALIFERLGRAREIADYELVVRRSYDLLQEHEAP